MAEERQEGQERLIPQKPPKTEYRQVLVASIEYPEDSLKPSSQLVDSIREIGVRDPVRLSPRESTDDLPGGYDILDGLRRVGAVRSLLRNADEDSEDLERFSTIPAMIEVHDDTSGDAFATKVAGHATRRENPIVELEVIEHYRSKGLSDTEISGITKLMVGTIRKRSKLGNLNPTLREAVKDGSISSSVGEQAAGLPPAFQDDLADKLDQEGKVTAKDVREKRQVVRNAATEDMFEGMDENMFREPENRPTPTNPADYGREIAEIINDSGFGDAELVEPKSANPKEGSVVVTHEDGVSFRLRILPRKTKEQKGDGQ